MKLTTATLVTVIGGALVLSTASLSSAASQHGHAQTASRTASQHVAGQQVAGQQVAGQQVAGQQVAGQQATQVRSSQQANQVRLSLTPSSAALAQCFPKAKANVTVRLTTDTLGKDRFRIVASGLKPRTDFTVFLVEQANSPFGAAEYIGDFTTDRYGKSANTFNLIVEEAFAFNNVTRARTDLNSVGFWFADPKDDDECLGANSPVTGFDGDAEAGVQMMNSGSALLP